MKRVVSILLISASLVLLIIVIYALMFVEPESSWRKNAFVIVIFFIAIARFTIISLRHSKGNQL
jgi:membrane protein YdbS with pleckstrin-like domain